MQSAREGQGRERLAGGQRTKEEKGPLPCLHNLHDTGQGPSFLLKGTT